MLLLQYSAEAGHLKSEVDYENVDGVIIIVLMEKSPNVFKEFNSDRYIHRITKAHADSGMEFGMLKQMAFVQLDKALELYLTRSYNDDEDIELLKLFALMADINNDELIVEARTNPLIHDIREDLFKFTRDKEVQQMILAEDLAIMDWNSNMRLAKSQGEAIGVARGMAQGVAQGVAQGEDKLAKLINQLLSLGRTDDVMKATNDVKAREQFYKEFGIIDPPAET